MTPSDLRLELFRELDRLAALPDDERPADYWLRRRNLWRRAAALALITDPIGPLVQGALFEVVANA